jgi:3-oxoacyl-[acyl-carrier-protein] synthase I
MSTLKFRPLRVTAYTVCTAAGTGRAATLSALAERRSGLTRNDFGPSPLATWIGRVPGLEDEPLPVRWAEWECRNNRLAWRGLVADDFVAAVAAARERHGAERIAVVIGTSTASIGASEDAYRRLEPDGRYPADLRRPIVHTPHSLGDFVQHALELRGMAVTVATACSSSAKVFGQAERLIRAGLADAAVVGGVDTLCGSTLFGFNSLELIASERCRPFDVARRGINIGEAAGFALLERAAEEGAWLLGYGESSDAHHMSTPHPEGIGARRALQDALATAQLTPASIDYINLHGTASLKNDEVEAALIARAFPPTTRASSTKGFTGHTLGAAGILEAVVALLSVEHGLVPGNLGGEDPDPACGPQFAWSNEARPVEVALSNSFGFGGNNACLAFARAERTA